MTAHLFRECSGKMTAVLSHTFGLQHLDTVMDAVQDSFETALAKWKFSGIPENPEGWLMQVAKNKVLNILRHDSKVILSDPVFISGNADGYEDSVPMLSNEVEDAQLRLLLMCCQPDLPDRTQVMLTLHILCGFGVVEISTALIVGEEAVKKALSRAKVQLKERSNLIYTPSLLQFEKRLHIVHAVLYLIFNEGYKTTRSKDVINHDLCYEAIRLTKLLLKEGVALKHDTNALLALMFFSLSRFPSRVSAHDELLTLAEQDRSLWDKVFIEEGYYYLQQAKSGSNASRFYLEALISSIHCAAPSFDRTDWHTIVKLYELLEQIEPSPLVTLNKVLAQSYLTPTIGMLATIAEFRNEPFFKEHYLLHAAEGDLLKRLGDPYGARSAFQHALELASSPREIRFFQRRIIECSF